MSRTKNKHKYVTIYPAISREEAHKAFLKSVGKASDNGANNYTAKFLMVMQGVIDNARSFTLGDVIRESKPYDLPVESVKDLFTKYVEKMTQLHKVELVGNLVYDDAVYLFV